MEFQCLSVALRSSILILHLFSSMTFCFVLLLMETISTKSNVNVTPTATSMPNGNGNATLPSPPHPPPFFPTLNMLRTTSYAPFRPRPPHLLSQSTPLFPHFAHTPTIPPPTPTRIRFICSSRLPIHPRFSSISPIIPSTPQPFPHPPSTHHPIPQHPFAPCARRVRGITVSRCSLPRWLSNSW